MAEGTGTATETARAAAHGKPADAPAAGAEAEAGEGGAGAAQWELDPMGDGFIRRFVGLLVHLRRYAKFYAVGAVWMLMMALVPAFGGRAEPPFGFASAGADAAPSSLSADPAPAPVGDAPALGDIGPTEEFAYTPYESFASAPEATRSDEQTTPPASSGASAPTVAPAPTTTPAPTPLRITESGYAAAGGGTPADTTPDEGLPVAVAAGNESKRSFIELAGTDTVLRLRLADASHRFPDAARVQACVITGDWAPERGAPLSESPSYDCSRGVLADVDGDLFTFDLSGIPGGPGGQVFALVAYTASDPTITFEVVFAEEAVTDAG